MHLITALAAGVNGAGSGTATIYRRGTSTLATTYTSFEGTATSTNPVVLDANGGATVYVNDVVDITVRGSTGTTVRQFTDGYGGQNVEIRSTSFTGTDYTTGASAVENPIALTTLLDKWDDSAGADDFWVKPGAAAAVRLKTALGPLTNLIFNVQDATYGATGDGTDQTTAINAAVTACETAGGGIVYFPPGTYLHTGDMLTGKSKVSLLGAGAGATVIKINHATNNLVTADTATTGSISIEGITFDDTDVSGLGSTGSLVKVTNGNVSVRDCYFTRPANSNGPMFDGSGTTARAFIDNCIFVGAHATANLVSSSCSARFSRCVFKTTAATYNTSTAMVYGTLQWLDGCEFDASASTAGTITYWASSSTTLRSSIVQTRFLAGGGATVTGITLGTYANNSYFYEAGNIFLCNTAYSYTPGATATTQAVILGTRNSTGVVSTSTSANITVPSDQYSTWSHILGSTSSHTLTLALAPVGSTMTLHLGSTAGTPTWTIAGTNRWHAAIDADAVGTSTSGGDSMTLHLRSTMNAAGATGWVVVGHSTVTTWNSRA